MSLAELSDMQTSGPGRIAPSAAEEHLLRRAKGGDLGAFEVLYRDHVGRVFAICRRMTGDHARAEELTQETFLRAWTRLGTFRRGHSFRPWLGKVAVNVDGGLKAKGHPVGATGAAQVVEIVEQLRGNCGERQVEGARVGLVDTLGGDLGTCVNIVLRRAS